MDDTKILRDAMVARQVLARGISNSRVLAAMRSVPREAFMPEDLAEFAYEDTPLPIEEGQTISQPYIVALMIAAIEPRAEDRVLEIGTGSGYAAAVLSRAVREVYTVERHGTLADQARRRFKALRYENISVLHGDGSLGWPEHAPYDAIIVTASGPHAPRELRNQLAIGGHMIIPIGADPHEQDLIRITRVTRDRFEEDDLGAVRFVPLVGQDAWPAESSPTTTAVRTRQAQPAATVALLRETAEAFEEMESLDLEPLLDRIGRSRVVLLGEATHGSSEFYRMRARITRELVVNRGFTIVAVEADWPDAARVHRYVRHDPPVPDEDLAFQRFPTWMWRNDEVHAFVSWMRSWNADIADPSRRIGFYGLDLYSMFASVAAVLRYLDEVDPASARVARSRYACLSPWERDPAVYGRATLTGRYRTCEEPVTRILLDMLERRIEYSARDGDRFLDASQNARLVADAEKYYRVMYYGQAESWNLRDRHMFETLEATLDFHGPESRAVVWEHNSHIGDASATEMSARGEFNVGQLCRQRFGQNAYLIGFGTDHGTVAAASDWGGPMERMAMRPAHARSYERIFHDTGTPALLLPLRHPRRAEVRQELSEPRLERAIGVIYRPETELQSHYFQALLPDQFDEYVWFDETEAVHALPTIPAEGVPETYPFGV
jgi:protein-L-isoaspartate(D-aspartate) O-methyltransferase